MQEGSKRTSRKIGTGEGRGGGYDKGEGRGMGRERGWELRSKKCFS